MVIVRAFGGRSGRGDGIEEILTCYSRKFEREDVYRCGGGVGQEIRDE